MIVAFAKIALLLAAAQSKPVTSALASFLPVNLAPKSFPAGFKGDDLKKFSEIALGIIQSKSEFETDAQYKKRINDRISLLRFGSLKWTDNFAFSPSEIRSRHYDIDKKMCSIRIDQDNDFHPVDLDHPGEMTFLVLERVQEAKKYESQNGFGASVQVTYERSNRYCLRMKDPTDGHSEWGPESGQHSDGFVLQFPMEPKQAQAKLLRLSVLFVVGVDRRLDGLINLEPYRQKPTFEQPIDLDYLDFTVHVQCRCVIVYDPITGEIIVAHALSV